MGIRDCQSGVRAQSGPLGFILVFAVVVASSTAVVALGAGAIDSSQSSLDVERAEKVMTQLDSQAALVALGQSRSQRVDLAATRSNGYRIDDGAGWMNITYENATGVRKSIYNTTMGAAVYETSDGTTLAYQGGGVWRSDGGSGSVMVSPPEFHYREATLTLPLVTVSGEGSMNNRVVVTENSSTQYFPNPGMDEEFENPLEGGKVNVTVGSEYYRAWGSHFAERTDGEVHYDHANEEVTIELTIPIETTFDNVVATTASNGISSNGADPPPSPYEEGVNYPSVDEQIEEEIDDCGGGSCTTASDSITSSGTYYSTGEFTGDLSVDNPGGNVTLVVDGGFNPDDVTITNVDDHMVSVYVREDVAMGGEVNSVDGDATELKVLVHSDGDVDFNGNMEFSGVLFAPGSECDLNGNADVTGALLCESMDINGNPNDFDYDPAVEDTALGIDYSDTTRITYLHVSVNDVNVTSG